MRKAVQAPLAVHMHVLRMCTAFFRLPIYPYGCTLHGLHSFASAFSQLRHEKWVFSSFMSVVKLVREDYPFLMVFRSHILLCHYMPLYNSCMAECLSV